MFEIGRLCVKIAGRDSGKKGVIIDLLDNNYVLIDGEVRRKKCNIKHLEPIDKVIKISKNASHEEVISILNKEGFQIKEKVIKEVIKEKKKELNNKEKKDQEKNLKEKSSKKETKKKKNE